MKIEPYIIDGPKFCGKCEGAFCDHERTMQWLGIYFVLDDGTEMGQCVMTRLDDDGELSEWAREYMESALWSEYHRWMDNEIRT